MVYDVVIVGGGAAGFFTAINCAELNPKLKIAILERGGNVLSKVKVSGGGRCNVTHAEFVPQELVKYYPRGEKELLGPFHTFMTGDTMQWFEERGVPLKIEDDGRVFPESNNSQSIIDCFLHLAQKYQIAIFKGCGVKAITFSNNLWELTTTANTFSARKLMVATGSSPKVLTLIAQLGHKVVPSVPSLFTFNCDDERLKAIPGVVAKNAKVEVVNTALESFGPLLITHSGFSAPAILKLSAYGALKLAQLNYKFTIKVNFINEPFSVVLDALIAEKHKSSKKAVYNTPCFNVPKRLWQQLVKASNSDDALRWADANKTQISALTSQLTEAVFKIDGKSTFKEEFVTAGGVALKEINFKTFQSKRYDTLYFAGEVLNIDAVTGGFNFQNAWTGGYIAAQHISKH